MGRIGRSSIIVVAGLALASCDVAGDGPVRVDRDLATLRRAESCDDVLVQLRHRITDNMEASLQANLRQALSAASTCTQASPGSAASQDSGSWTCAGSACVGGGSSASEYSQTNNQVGGVDEADFVKNDGEHIYLVADGKLQIVDAWPAAEAHTIAAVPVEGTPTKLYVHADRAVVYSQLGPISGSSGGRYGGYGQSECTYGYDCEFAGDGQVLKVSVFDIANRESPALVREIVLSGSYLNSRRIGNIVHTVAVFPEVAVPGLETWPPALDHIWDCVWTRQPSTHTESQIRAAFFRLWLDNVAKIEQAGVTEFLPGFKDTRHVDGQTVVEEGLLADCSNFYVSQAGDGRSFLSLVSFDATDLGPLGLTTIVGKPGAVYASTDALYVAERHYLDEMQRWYYESSEGIEEATTVHKFRLYPDSIASLYVGSGVTKGRVLNQFAMDEHDGYLRMATTTGHLPDPTTHNTLAVLAERDGGLSVTGLLDHLAPSEDIRAVRFSGDTGFVVTFKKTDPLFVIDLADPTAPAIKGELKIPGFSTYMHLLDEKHLLSVGFDAQDMGDFAWFAGFMLQIFDVTDLANPTLMHKEVIGTRGSSSDAATNHLAFNYFPPKDLLALPMVICEGGSGGSYGDQMTFNGLLVYRVTLAEGFTKLGGIPHAVPTPTGPFSCGSWWSSSTSEVKRSVIMDDFVYSVASDLIQISRADDLEHPVATVQLVQP
jgi:hypothetical protein